MVPSRTLLVAAFLAYVTAAAVASGGGGGGGVDDDKFPWQAVVKRDDGKLGGGVIISQKWVLTTGYCVQNHTKHSYEIRVGFLKNFAGGNVYAVGKFVVHRNYNPPFSRNDIAALQTTSPIEFGVKVKPAKLPGMCSPRVRVGSLLRYTNYFYGARVIPLVDPIHCSIYAPYFAKESQLCVGNSTMEGCFLPSGWPLTSDDVLVGLSSYGLRNCSFPSTVFTDVSFYREWIKINTGV